MAKKSNKRKSSKKRGNNRKKPKAIAPVSKSSNLWLYLLISFGLVYAIVFIVNDDIQLRDDQQVEQTPKNTTKHQNQLQVEQVYGSGPTPLDYNLQGSSPNNVTAPTQDLQQTQSSDNIQPNAKISNFENLEIN